VAALAALRRLLGLRASARPPFKRKPILEALEPRVLLSVDLSAVAPLGSMVHAAHQSGTFATADQDVSYTLSLDAGQKVSVSLAAADSSGKRWRDGKPASPLSQTVQDIANLSSIKYLTYPQASPSLPTQTPSHNQSRNSSHNWGTYSAMFLYFR